MRYMLTVALFFSCGPSAETDAGSPDAAVEMEGGSSCDVLPAEMEGCASCHTERASIEGWYEQPEGSRLESDTWGRRAFYVLFTQANSATVPAHRTSYAWAEECFCQNRSEEPWRCYTLTGEFEEK